MRPEVVVLGGGPAGSVAAAALARNGHDVVLITRRRAQGRPLAESLPPSTRKLLRATGLIAAVERAGFHPNGGNTVWWAGAPCRSESFAGATGFQVEATNLERIALASARVAGAHIIEAGARSARQQAGGWLVEGRGFAVRAPWLIDATGRAGMVARQGLRTRDGRPRTLALVARWQHASGWHPDECTHTLVESYRDGWAWSVPLSRTSRCVTAMVDPDATDLDRRGDLADTYRAELAKTEHLSQRLAEAAPEGAVWACPATAYTASSFCRPGLVLVGDAGSFIDPLSSFGVKKALASAWLAGVVVHSALTEPGITDAALALFDHREREMFARYESLSAAFCAEAAAFHGHPFWGCRARPGAVNALVNPGAALDELRTCRTLDLVPGRTVRTVRKPIIRNARVVLDDALATDDEPDGATHVHGVDLRRLVDQAGLHRQVPALHAAAAAHVPMPDFLAALAHALMRGYLRQRS